MNIYLCILTKYIECFISIYWCVIILIMSQCSYLGIGGIV